MEANFRKQKEVFVKNGLKKDVSKVLHKYYILGIIGVILRPIFHNFEKPDLLIEF